jgi:hypothetical protein
MRYLARLTAVLLMIAGTCPGQHSVRPPLLEAVARGDAGAVKRLIASGAPLDAATASGKTALIEAAERGRADAARLLIAAGADLNVSDRGAGTALEAAERAGHADVAAMLRQAGARPSGRSVGDTVCVRPWKGDGYCGVVSAISSGGEYRLRVTEVVGCTGGCAARTDCSGGRPVGGSRGLQAGDSITIPSSCLTHTGVKP